MPERGGREDFVGAGAGVLAAVKVEVVVTFWPEPDITRVVVFRSISSFPLAVTRDATV
jgi:hypothetical protein